MSEHDLKDLMINKMGIKREFKTNTLDWQLSIFYL